MLHGLHAQVLRVLTSSVASVEEVSVLLRSSVAQLQAEMDAVAEALESVAHDAPAPPARVDGGDPEGAGPGGAPRGRVRG